MPWTDTGWHGRGPVTAQGAMGLEWGTEGQSKGQCHHVGRKWSQASGYKLIVSFSEDPKASSPGVGSSRAPTQSPPTQSEAFTRDKSLAGWLQQPPQSLPGACRSCFPHAPVVGERELEESWAGLPLKTSRPPLLPRGPHHGLSGPAPLALLLPPSLTPKHLP